MRNFSIAQSFATILKDDPVWQAFKKKWNGKADPKNSAYAKETSSVNNYLQRKLEEME